MTAATPIEMMLAPVDATRRTLLRAFGPVARRLIVDRELRVAVYGVSAVATALAATLFCPLWLMGVGPVTIGVPHLLADIRYLVLRPGLHRRAAFWLAIALPLALGYAIPTGHLGMLAVAGALVMSRVSNRRRLLGLGVWALAYAAILQFGRTADLLVLQLHNLLTLALWWSWRPHRVLKAGWVFAAFAVASAVILGGAAEPLVHSVHGFWAPATGLRFPALARALVPFRDPVVATRLVLFYGFAQALHYVVWIRVIPEDDRARATPRTFAASWRALRADFGAWGLTAATVASLGMAAWAVVDLVGARAGYVKASLFHFDLEFAIVALCWAERQRPGRAGIPRLRNPSRLDGARKQARNVLAREAGEGP